VELLRRVGGNSPSVRRGGGGAPSAAAARVGIEIVGKNSFPPDFFHASGQTRLSFVTPCLAQVTVASASRAIWAEWAARAIAASAGSPSGWISPADMINFAAVSGAIGSSMMSLVGTKK
jgi:hypothetical protein